MRKTIEKHKRGERGSLEEEDNVSKRCNMADSVGVVPIVKATQTEPRLIDIKLKEMLVLTVVCMLKPTKYSCDNTQGKPRTEARISRA